MKSKIGILAIIFLLTILANSCIPSIYPIYTKDKLVTLSNLEGNWVEKTSEPDEQKDRDEKLEQWKFAAAKDKSYLLVHTDDEGKSAAFDVHVIKLKDDYFIDFYPTDMPSEDKGPFGNLSIIPEEMNVMRAWHIIPVHTFAKVEISNKELKISMFDPDFLEKLLERRQIRIKHETTHDGFVLTASPEELQKFAAKYADTKEAFIDGPIVLTK